MKSQSDKPSERSSVQDRVFLALNNDQVEPRSKYVFLCQNASLWLVWLVTVSLGALATAVLIFTSTYRYYDIYEAMHDNFVTYFVQALPVLWIVAFAALMLLAIRGLRATKRGYRFSVWLIGGSSVGMSVFLGFIASLGGFGYWVDKTLGDYAPMYYSMAEREEKIWLQPSEGRLTGRADGENQQNTDQTTFTDVSGTDWTLSIAELRPYDRKLLGSNKQVRVLGTQIPGSTNNFHACGVFPWMMDKQQPVHELNQQRQEAIARLYGHKDDHDKRLERLEQQVFDGVPATNTLNIKICAQIAAVRRISEQMR